MIYFKKLFMGKKQNQLIVFTAFYIFHESGVKNLSTIALRIPVNRILVLKTRARPLEQHAFVLKTS